MLQRMLPLAVVLWATACGGPRYVDDPDLTGARKVFRCEAPAGPIERRACVGMRQFDSGGPVKSYPEEGTTVYLGRHDCSSDTDEIVFSVFGLGAGTSPADVDDAHKPDGIVLNALKSVAYSDLRRTAAYVTLGKLEDKEDSPFLTAPQKEDGALPDSWDGWRDLLTQTATTPMRTANSDGKSLLEAPGRTPAAWDDAEETSAVGYLRENGDELIYVQPPDEAGIACVAHVHALP